MKTFKVLTDPIRATRKGIFNLKEGDMIRCRPICRWRTRWTWRKVVTVDRYGKFGVGVKYNDCNPFWIKPWTENRKIREISHLRRLVHKLKED